MDDSLLQKIIKYQFRNPDLLHEALAKGTKGSQSEMKQLALLGDALLSLNIAEMGYNAGACTGANLRLSFEALLIRPGTTTHVIQELACNDKLKVIAWLNGLDRFVVQIPSHEGRPSRAFLA